MSDWLVRLNNWGIWGVILILLMIVFGYGNIIIFNIPLIGRWILVLSLMFIFLLVLGKITGSTWGIFIDGRNQASLSRFQFVSWTLIIISAYFTLALSNIQSLSIQSTVNPINETSLLNAIAIALPPEIWAQIGISTSALVGTNLIISNLYGQKYKKDENGKSIICKNENPADAKFSDIFKGDENEECDKINLAKVQMFYFTLIVLISYVVLLLQLMATKNPPIEQFPTISEEFVILLAISNGGYLAQKAIPAKPTQDRF